VTESKNAVFLSYAAEDAAPAQRLCATLRAAGIEVWFDQSELRGGDAWDTAIRKQIKDCSLFIPLISANSQARAEGYFRLEWKLAVDRSHLMAADKAFLLPVMIDDTHDADARVPDKFREVQWTSLPGGETPPSFVERLRLLLSAAEGPAPAPVRSAFSASIPEKAISVLPFINHAGTPDLDTLAKCLVEDLAGQLARTPGFRVVAQPTVAAPRARYVISGSVRQQDSGCVRVAIQIIEGESSQYVWTMQQDLVVPCATREVDDFVAGATAKIEQQLTLVEARESHKGTAHDAWSKLRQANSALFSAGWSEEAVESAVHLFREAIALDPKLALARAQKALIMALASQWGLLRGDDLREEARADAEKALELEPTKSEVLGCAGCALADLGDTARALPLLERAIEENPNNAQAWAALGAAQLLCRQYEASIESLRRGLRISPTDYRRSVWLTALTRALIRTGKLDQALAAAQDACRADAKFYPSQILLAVVLTKLGKEAEAVRALTEARRIRPRLAIGEIRRWAGQALDRHAASLGL
jgi:TolB-like protein/cytochrome c-type biogenesis protein CcmH/NrfG